VIPQSRNPNFVPTGAAFGFFASAKGIPAALLRRDWIFGQTRRAGILEKHTDKAYDGFIGKTGA